MSLLELKSNYCKLGPDQRLYGLNIPLIGLSGGIASGKSSASALLRQKGAPLIDADALVKDIYAEDETKELVKSLVPESVQAEEIDFKTLREVFFADDSVKKRLEEHIYKRLPGAFASRLNEYAGAKFVVYDVPLLFEKGLQKAMDSTVLIYAPRELQLERLRERDRIDEKLAERILASQMPIEQKRGLADKTIENTKDFNYLSEQIDAYLKDILKPL